MWNRGGRGQLNHVGTGCVEHQLSFCRLRFFFVGDFPHEESSEAVGFWGWVVRKKNAGAGGGGEGKFEVTSSR